jgi:hypothetical protein
MALTYTYNPNTYIVASAEITSQPVRQSFLDIQTKFATGLDVTDLGDDCVETAKIKDANVTAAKLASDVNLRFVIRYPTTADFDTTTHMADWGDWDISSIVPTNCYAIKVTLVISDDTATSYVGIRPNGGDDVNFVGAKCATTGSTYRMSEVVPVNSNLTAGQTVEIRVHDNAGSPTAVTYVKIFINGYYVK